MSTPSHDIFLFGALRVILDSATGTVLAVLDAISGKNASGIFRECYINAAATKATLAWKAQADF